MQSSTAPAGLDHQQNPARLFKGGDELLRGAAAGHRQASGPFEKSGGLLMAAIPGRDAEMVIRQIQREIFPHDRETGDSDFRQLFFH